MVIQRFGVGFQDPGCVYRGPMGSEWLEMSRDGLLHIRLGKGVSGSIVICTSVIFEV